MVLVPLKKTLTLYFTRVCLYCSLRPFVKIQITEYGGICMDVL